MMDRDKIKCPHCGGEGTVKIPGFSKGKPITKEKECGHCKGTGILVLTVDARIFNGNKPKKSNIILPPGIVNPEPGIILPKGYKKELYKRNNKK